MTIETFDVIIIGAGLSGVDAAVRLQKQSPSKSSIILEARERIGGTWDLFRYPGVRSDSDMATLSYPFRPWTGSSTLAEGEAIRNYIEETAAAYGVDKNIKFSHRVVAASWSSGQALWTLTIETSAGAEKTVQIQGRFVIACAGYYRYDNGYTPDFAGMKDFSGAIVHPQNWPRDLDYSGQRVLIIGSGATAVSLAPEMAKTAAHVTLLQRTPTYMLSLPAQDPAVAFLQKFLPLRLASRLARLKNVIGADIFYRLCRRWPNLARKYLMKETRKALGEGYDVERHFNPPYAPWDQRLCVVLDGDLFKAVKSGACEIVTDEIARFTKTGVALKSGRAIDAPIVVAATGLALQVLGGAKITVDGAPYDPSKALYYKSAMFSGLPNLCAVFGYVNATWTLKADLVAHFACRVLNEMDRKGAAIATPVCNDPAMGAVKGIAMTSGYFSRAEAILPKQGRKNPWRLSQNYPRDILLMRLGKIDDGVLKFSGFSRNASGFHS